MTNGYLLDTNVISVLANPRNPRRTDFEHKVRAMEHVWLPVVAIAEIEFGMAKAEKVDETQRNDVRAFFQRYPQHLGFHDNTVEPYALVTRPIVEDSRDERKTWAQGTCAGRFV